MNDCLVCRGAQEVVIGVREVGPFERMHEYTRVLFCAACDVGELRTFSYDGFVVFGEEDEVMVWSSVLSAPDIARLRAAFACSTPLDHACECAQHARAYETSVQANKTRLPAAGRTAVVVEVADGLAVFR